MPAERGLRIHRSALVLGRLGPLAHARLGGDGDVEDSRARRQAARGRSEGAASERTPRRDPRRRQRSHVASAAPSSHGRVDRRLPLHGHLVHERCSALRSNQIVLHARQASRHCELRATSANLQDAHLHDDSNSLPGDTVDREKH